MLLNKNVSKKQKGIYLFCHLLKIRGNPRIGSLLAFKN
ncbi:hypothetical protein B0G93_11046 [Bacillus sp. V-88]|nr:hypothetical protein B0G93_11046 [Bacillus sp. V-88]SLK23141.1 hypothetical protein SAMN06295884_11046 [Bacillus sp. V-88]